MNNATRFVTFPLGGEYYALDSKQVKELLMPAPIYAFPHTMHSLEGVLMRNGMVVPVCDLGGAFGDTGERSYYVVAQCQYEGNTEVVAIPVNGDCEIVQGELSEAPDEVSFVKGMLQSGARSIPLLDLDRVVKLCVRPMEAGTAEVAQ